MNVNLFEVHKQNGNVTVYKSCTNKNTDIRNLTITPPNMTLTYEKLQDPFAGGNWFEERQ